MDDLDYNKLNKNKYYCYSCFKKGIISELSIHNSKEYCIPCEKHKGRGFFRLQFCKNNNKFAVFRGITFGNRSQSEINKDIYQSQKKNKTGWCSEESIMKRNSYKNNCIRQQNAIKRGNKKQSIITQLKMGLHPTQNLSLQNKKTILMQLRKIGINKSLDEINLNSYFEIFNNLDINIENKKVLYEEINLYNNRCGAIGLTVVCKNDNIRYALNAGKSINLGNEIRKFFRVLNQPEKQNKDLDYGRWYNISNNYYNFEIIILCIDVSEEKSLLTESVWAIKNNAQFKYSIDNNGKKFQKEKTHGYWM